MESVAGPLVEQVKNEIRTAICNRYSGVFVATVWIHTDNKVNSYMDWALHLPVGHGPTWLIWW